MKTLQTSLIKVRSLRWQAVPPPPILFANRESFSLLSRFYKRTFGRKHEILVEDKTYIDLHGHPQKEILDHGFYICGQLDTLYISWHGFLYYDPAFITTQLPAFAHDPAHQDRRNAVKDVQNLAILVDDWAMEDIGGQSLIITSDGVRYPVIPYEDLIAQTLHAFGSVKHLTIVVKDYDYDDPRNPSIGTLILRDIRLVELSHIEAAHQVLGDDFHDWPVKLWNEEYREDWEGDCTRYFGCREPGRVKRYSELATLDLDRLEMSRAKMVEEGKDVTWKIPEIEYKVVISAFEMDFKDWVDKLRKEKGRS